MVCLSASLFKFLPFVFTVCWTLDWHEVRDFLGPNFGILQLDLRLCTESWQEDNIALHYRCKSSLISLYKSTFMSGSDRRCFSQVSKLKNKYLFAQQRVQPRVTKLTSPKLVAVHHSWFHNQNSTTSNRKGIVTLWNIFMGDNILPYAWRRDSQIKR